MEVHEVLLLPLRGFVPAKHGEFPHPLLAARRSEGHQNAGFHVAARVEECLLGFREDRARTGKRLGMSLVPREHARRESDHHHCALEHRYPSFAKPALAGARRTALSETRAGRESNVKTADSVII